MAGQRSAALLVVHDGKLRLERYGLGFDADGRWTSFSVAKSITSTLVGAAMRDGHIKSMDDKVTDYIPQMKGSAYDDVSIRQLLTMTSGVQLERGLRRPELGRGAIQQPQARGRRRRARELPAAPAARGAARHALELQHGRNQPRRHPRQPGDEEAAGRPTCRKRSGCPRAWSSRRPGFSARPGRRSAAAACRLPPRDYARFGQFILGGARVNGQSIVPEGWLAEATTTRTGIGQPDRGYGYQWWTYADGSYAARGIFGQGIFIDPKRKIVIVSNANWAERRDEIARRAARERRSTLRCRRPSMTRLRAQACRSDSLRLAMFCA